MPLIIIVRPSKHELNLQKSSCYHSGDDDEACNETAELLHRQNILNITHIDDINFADEEDLAEM